jgi:NAD(P)-dependent dehydrogenase (short-subunit alcohol dehydrogenase family)
LGRIEGKVAVVTGGASGIGEGTVRRFVEEGARVVIADVQDGRGSHLAEELGPNTAFVHTDVSQEDQVRAVVDYAVSKWGRLDCMYNNAGFGGVNGPVETIDMDAYDQTMSVLLRGVFLGVKHAAAVMKEQRQGSIISTASIAGVQAGFGPVVYSAAKAAVMHLTRCVALELAEFEVRANAICPGLTLTNIFTAALGLDDSAREAAISRVDYALHDWAPLGRSGLPADIANAALWLASDESSYVTGQSIIVDGGLTAGRNIAELGGRLAAAFGMTPPAPPQR